MAEVTAEGEHIPCGPLPQEGRSDSPIGSKRKASEEATTPDSSQKLKKARTESPERGEKVRGFVLFEMVAD